MPRILTPLCSLENMFESENDFDVSEEYYIKAVGMQFQLFGRDAQCTPLRKVKSNLSIPSHILAIKS